jgi:hypothetical protein
MNKEFGMAEGVSLTICTILAMACRGMRKTTKTAIQIIFTGKDLNQASCKHNSQSSIARLTVG